MKLKDYAYPLTLADGSTAASIVGLVGKGKRVLELGCSSGAQSKVLVEELNCTVVGVEINPEAAEKAKAYCERVIVGNLEQLDLALVLGEDRFDVILCADVLEHLTRPEKILRDVSSLIRPGGYIVLSVPNVSFAGLVFELANGEFNYRRIGLLDDTHVRFFTRRSLVSLLSSTGYELQKLSRAGAEPVRSEFSIRTNRLEDRVLLDYMTIHNPECMTYQFIGVAGVSKHSAQENTLQNEKLEASDLSAHLLLQKERIDASQRRFVEYFEEFPRSHSDLDWLKRKGWFRVGTTLANFLSGLMRRKNSGA